MHTITFKCKTVTPLFMGGADGKTPELRPPSIKGALRFWWRAVHGDLELSQLKEQEKHIFGGVGKGENGSRQSTFFIRVLDDATKTETKFLEPRKHFRGDARVGGFTLELSLKPNSPMTPEQLKSLFILTTILGGFGKRSRRGMGVVVIDEVNGQPCNVETLRDIYHHLRIIHNQFELRGDVIRPTFRSQARYPYIREIQIGNPARDDLTLKISQATHDINQKHGYEYGPAMGMARAGARFASPMYASIIQTENGLIPVLTSLNTASYKRANFDVQRDFKNEVLP